MSCAKTAVLQVSRFGEHSFGPKEPSIRWVSTSTSKKRRQCGLCQFTLELWATILRQVYGFSVDFPIWGNLPRSTGTLDALYLLLGGIVLPGASLQVAGRDGQTPVRPITQPAHSSVPASMTQPQPAPSWNDCSFPPP